MNKLALLLLFSVSLSAQLQDKTREQCVATVDYEVLIGRDRGREGAASPPIRRALWPPPPSASACIPASPRRMRNAEICTCGRRSSKRRLTDYSRAIELEPKTVSWYIGRGFAHLRQEQFDAAKADYDKALQIEPRRPRRAHQPRGSVSRPERQRTRGGGLQQGHRGGQAGFSRRPAGRTRLLRSWAAADDCREVRSGDRRLHQCHRRCRHRRPGVRVACAGLRAPGEERPRPRRLRRHPGDRSAECAGVSETRRHSPEERKPGEGEDGFSGSAEARSCERCGEEGSGHAGSAERLRLRGPGPGAGERGEVW